MAGLPLELVSVCKIIDSFSHDEIVVTPFSALDTGLVIVFRSIVSDAPTPQLFVTVILYLPASDEVMLFIFNTAFVDKTAFVFSLTQE